MRAIGKYVVVELVKMEEKSQGGVYFPPGFRNVYMRGKVLSVGEGAGISISIGDVVLFRAGGRSTGMVILHRDEVLAVVE